MFSTFIFYFYCYFYAEDFQTRTSVALLRDPLKNRQLTCALFLYFTVSSRLSKKHSILKGVLPEDQNDFNIVCLTNYIEVRLPDFTWLFIGLFALWRKFTEKLYLRSYTSPPAANLPVLKGAMLAAHLTKVYRFGSSARKAKHS